MDGGGKGPPPASTTPPLMTTRRLRSLTHSVSQAPKEQFTFLDTVN